MENPPSSVLKRCELPAGRRDFVGKIWASATLPWPCGRTDAPQRCSKSNGFMMVLWWFYDGFMMVLWWFYMVLYMVVWWIIMIVPNVPLLWGSLTPVTTLSSRNRLSMLDGQHPQSRATGPSWTNLSTSLVELIGHNAGVSGSGGVPTHGKQLALAPAWTPTRALGFWEVPTLTCAWHPALQMLQQNPTYTSTGPWWKSATLLGVGVFPYSR